MENKTKKTFLDKRFEAFSNLVLQAIKDNKSSVFFCGRATNFVYDPKDLAQLLEIRVGDTAYTLLDNLECKARLAKDGFLGGELIPMGTRCLQAVEERKHRDAIKHAYKTLQELWGKYTKRIWQGHFPSAKSPKVAESVVAIMGAVEKGTPCPSSIKEARKAGVRLRFLSTTEWEDCVKILKYLTHIKESRNKDK